VATTCRSAQLNAVTRTADDASAKVMKGYHEAALRESADKRQLLRRLKRSRSTAPFRLIFFQSELRTPG